VVSKVVKPPTKSKVTISQQAADVGSSNDDDEEEEAELQRSKLADSVFIAVTARLSSMTPSRQALRNQASACDLVPPPWPGKLNLKSDPSKLAVWIAARTRYVEVCGLSEHAPVPLHCTGKFSSDEFPRNVYG
jgi:hypothetical protein